MCYLQNKGLISIADMCTNFSIENSHFHLNTIPLFPFYLICTVCQGMSNDVFVFLGIQLSNFGVRSSIIYYFGGNHWIVWGMHKLWISGHLFFSIFSTRVGTVSILSGIWWSDFGWICFRSWKLDDYWLSWIILVSKELILVTPYKMKPKSGFTYGYQEVGAGGCGIWPPLFSIWRWKNLHIFMLNFYMLQQIAAI